MNELSIWQSIITACFALAGAGVGFLAALSASRQATSTAYRAALYSKQLERQQEVLNNLYELTSLAHQTLSDLLDVGRAEVPSQRGAYHAQKEVASYFLKHQIWIPQEQSEKFRALQDLLVVLIVELGEAAKNPALSDTEYELVREKINRRVDREVVSSLSYLARSMMPLLGLARQGVFILGNNETIGELDRPRRSWWRRWFGFDGR